MKRIELPKIPKVPFERKEPVLEPTTIRRTMNAEFERFFHLGKVGEVERMGKMRRHVHIQRGSKVLGVVHMDSVCEPEAYWQTSKYICHAAVDDRIGAWVILHGLASMGIFTDILLTEDEELGKSTAQDFKPPDGVDYNWIFSFDRGGTDVACYQYMGKELADILKPFDLVATVGANSCIAYMDRMGVKGMNFGVGMYDYHSPNAFVKVDELTLQMQRFSNFYHAYKDTKLVYEKPKWKYQNPITPFVKPSNHAGEGSNTDDVARGSDYYDEDGMWYGTPNRRLSEENWLHAAMTKDMNKGLAIYNQLKLHGINNRYFGGLGPELWWATTFDELPKNQSYVRGRIVCKYCGGLFDAGDVHYMHHVSKSFCLSCYMSQLASAGLIEDDWFELATVDKRKASEDGEKETAGTDGDTRSSDGQAQLPLSLPVRMEVDEGGDGLPY